MAPLNSRRVIEKLKQASYICEQETVMNCRICTETDMESTNTCMRTIHLNQ